MMKTPMLMRANFPAKLTINLSLFCFFVLSLFKLADIYKYVRVSLLPLTLVLFCTVGMCRLSSSLKKQWLEKKRKV